jgi:hypothetical protein
MDEIYLQYFEHIVLCSDEKQKKENRKELTQIFSKYTL